MTTATGGADQPLPETMRAFRQTQYGTEPAEILTETRLPLPSTDVAKGAPDRILVRVAASALNPLDTHLGSGYAKAVMAVKFPMTIGSDFAGTVVKVPAGVKTDLKPGDRVCGCLDVNPRVADGVGTFAEYVAPQTHAVVRIPDSMSFDEAAGVGVVAYTVWQSFVGQLGIAPPPPGATQSPMAAGKKLLILGGSTATGLVTTQIARAWGFADITVTSTQEALCKQYGATRVINYRDKTKGHEWWNVLAGENFDAMYNTAEGRIAWDKCGSVLRDNGRYNTLIIDYPEKPFTYFTAFRLMTSVLWRKTISWFGSPAFSLAIDTKPGLGIAECVDLVGKGTLRFPVDPRGPFPATMDGAQSMWKIQRASNARGKLVMRWV